MKRHEEEDSWHQLQLWACNQISYISRHSFQYTSHTSTTRVMERKKGSWKDSYLTTRWRHRTRCKRKQCLVPLNRKTGWFWSQCNRDQNRLMAYLNPNSQFLQNHDSISILRDIKALATFFSIVWLTPYVYIISRTIPSFTLTILLKVSGLLVMLLDKTCQLNCLRVKNQKRRKSHWKSISSTIFCVRLIFISIFRLFPKTHFRSEPTQTVHYSLIIVRVGLPFCMSHRSLLRFCSSTHNLYIQNWSS